MMVDAKSTEMAIEIARAADEKKAQDIIILDVSNLLYITDYFVICHAGNDRQVRSISENIEMRMKERQDRTLQVSGFSEGRWVLLDFGSVVVHVFLDEVRRFYDIERLWKDAPTLEWQA